MKTLLRLFSSGRGGRAGAPVSLFALFMVSGCGLFSNEDEGDPEPVLGEYEVTVSPNLILLTPQQPEAVLRLSVRCTGKNLPPGCDSNNPNWTSSPGQVFTLTQEIANPNSADTTMTIRVNPDDFLSAPSSLGERRQFFIGVGPAHIPARLTKTVGPGVLVIFENPLEGPAREPEPAEVPSVGGFPPLLPFASDATAFPVIRQARFIYKGPANTISEITLVDPGSHFIFQGPGPTVPVTSGQELIFDVTFLNNGTPGTPYRAELRAKAATGQEAVIELTTF